VNLGQRRPAPLQVLVTGVNVGDPPQPGPPEQPSELVGVPLGMHGDACPVRLPLCDFGSSIRTRYSTRTRVWLTVATTGMRLILNPIMLSPNDG
jgi:hypothetical protein